MKFPVRTARHSQRGLTILELVISMAISLFVLLAMVKLFNNTTRNNEVLTRAGDVVENGRIAVQLIADDLSHAGYLGGYVPTFDDVANEGIPLDLPTAIVDPCKAVGSWTRDDVINATGITIDIRGSVPTGTGCINGASLTSVSGSDVVIVRHADNCAVGDTGCDAYSAGLPYIQISRCISELQGQARSSSSTNTIQLAATASTTNSDYVGTLIRLTGGTGAGQVGRISAYNGTTQVATVDANWTTTPDATTQYSLPMTLGTTAWRLTQRTCLSTALGERRRLVSHMYFVANVSRGGQTVPTLMRSDLASNGASGISFSEPVAVIYGIEALRVVVGIDNLGKTGAAPDYTAAVAWQDATNHVTATNRGDGIPDSFVHCTACTAAQLRDVTAAKIYVLARSLDSTLGFKDTKTYCLGEPDTSGNCASGDTIAAKNDGFQRHVFVSSVRLTNVAGRRETP